MRDDPASLVLIAGVFGGLASPIIALILASLYSRRVRSLMLNGPSPIPTRSLEASWSRLPASGSPPSPATPYATLADNTRAQNRVLTRFACLSLAVSTTQWAISRYFYQPAPGFLLLLVDAWPLFTLFGLVLRWHTIRLLATVFVYQALIVAVMIIGSGRMAVLVPVLLSVCIQVSVPLCAHLAIGAHPRLRAAGPFVAPVVFLFTYSVLLALELFSTREADARGPYQLLFLLLIAAMVVSCWSAIFVGRWLARAYRRKMFSDLGYLFAAHWLVVLVVQALLTPQRQGFTAASLLLAWLWIPAAFLLSGKHLVSPDRGPSTLLVLRVFGSPSNTDQIFESVVDRWRLTGNTIFVAGSDAVSRLLDPDALFDYLARSLSQRFISCDADIRDCLAALDWQPDPDGRFRINKCYCYEHTWRLVVQTLLRKSDVVLMDLRGFNEQRVGCRDELAMLAQATHLHGIVLLHESDAERDLAEPYVSAGPLQGRLHWVQGKHVGSAVARRILNHLFDAPRIAEPARRVG